MMNVRYWHLNGSKLLRSHLFYFFHFSTAATLLILQIFLSLVLSHQHFPRLHSLKFLNARFGLALNPVPEDSLFY